MRITEYDLSVLRQAKNERRYLIFEREGKEGVRQQQKLMRKGGPTYHTYYFYTCVILIILKIKMSIFSNQLRLNRFSLIQLFYS